MAIEAITVNAPKSGSSSSSAPEAITATAMGRKPLLKLCIQSALRTV